MYVRILRLFTLPFFSGVGTGINLSFQTPCNCGELFDWATVLLGDAFGVTLPSRGESWGMSKVKVTTF